MEALVYTFLLVSTLGIIFFAIFFFISITSIFTLSPGRIRIELRRILPET